jgi:hypothetical protein
MKSLRAPINCGPCVCFTTVAVAVAVIVVIFLASIALSNASAAYGSKVYTKSGPVAAYPFGQILNGNGAPLAMTTDGAGMADKTFVMSDADGAPHTFTLTNGLHFDGTFTQATFDGTKGSWIEYRLVTNQRVAVMGKYGVTLS